MHDIGIYPLNFAPVAYLRAACCVVSCLNFRFWFDLYLSDCRA